MNKTLAFMLGLMASLPVLGAVHVFDEPTHDRWMYPFNASPGLRPAAPVFGTLSDAAGVDSRHGQFIMGWDTAPRIPAGKARWQYQIRRMRLTLVSLRDGSFVQDPSEDPWESYLPGGDPRARADADSGRPVELFGTGFRNGFTATTFEESSPFGSGAVGRRNAFAAGFNPSRDWVDVGNNVGKTNVMFAPFPSHPFAVGAVDGLGAGEPVPAGARVDFDLNLQDPSVRGYVQAALQSGRLWFTVTWLGGSSGPGGTPAYPDFATRDHLLYDGPRLELEFEVLESTDGDRDGLPDDWERVHFGGLASDGDDDVDGDGHSNLVEFEHGTDPSEAASLLAVRLLTPLPDGRIELAISDPTPGPPRVERSGDLRVWTPESGTIRFEDSIRATWTSLQASADGPLFYRVVKEVPAYP